MKGRNRHPDFLKDTSTFVDDIYIKAIDGEPISFYKEMGRIFNPNKLSSTELSLYIDNNNKVLDY